MIKYLVIIFSVITINICNAQAIDPECIGSGPFCNYIIGAGNNSSTSDLLLENGQYLLLETTPGGKMIL